MTYLPNREIKFRAWLPEVKIMLEEVTLYPGMIGLYEDQLRELVEAKGLKLYDDSIEDEEGSLMAVLQGEDWYWIEEGNFHVMQYTGLKDKNGVEIYEGDIAKTDKGHIVEIRWDFCSEKTEDWDFEYTGFCMYNDVLKRNFHLDKGNVLTVIGNIFQS